MPAVPNVAIACQGGGSHTAFTAGVQKRHLPALECPASYGETASTSNVGRTVAAGGLVVIVVGLSAWRDRRTSDGT